MQIEVGKVLSVKVTGITSFGAFVELPDGKTSGLVHISEIAEEYVDDVGKYLKRGQVVKAKIIGNNNGKISLSIKQAAAEIKNKQSDKSNDKSKKKRRQKNSGTPKSHCPPEEFRFASSRNSGELSFDDMLQKFKQDSDEKFQDLKRSNDNKRSGGYKRTY